MFENLDDYIAAHSSAEPKLLQKLNRQTHVKIINPRMLSGHIQGRILKMLTQMCGAKRVLELGTFTGYSALCFAEGLPQNGEVVTIDDNDELEEFADSFFQQSEHGHKITQLIGKALDVIPTLNGPFDIVFLDADKREYQAYFDAVFPLIPVGGYILADNTLWDGKVIQPIEPNDKQTISLLKFNESIANDSRVEVVILPLRDGLTLIRKIKN